MARVFKDSKASAAGKVLSYDKFVMYADIENRVVSDDKKAMAIARAEKALDKEIPFLPLSLYRDFFLTGNRANYETPFFARRNIMLDLLFGEMAEGKGRFLDKLADVVWAILEESSWTLPAHAYTSPTIPTTQVPEVYNSERVYGLALFSAATSAALSAVYLHAKDALDKISPVICERIAYAVKERAIKPFLTCTFWWTGMTGGRVCNWLPWITSNVLYATAVIERNTTIRTEVVTRAMSYLDNFTGIYHDDGGCDEGAGYWSHAGGSMFDCLEIIEDMTGGEVKVYSHPLIRAMGEYIARVNISGNRYVNFADCHALVGQSDGMIRRFGEKCGSEVLRTFGESLNETYKSLEVNPSAPYRSIKSLMTPFVTVKPTTRVARNTYFPDLKVLVSRENDSTGREMFLAFKGGHNDECHNHNDVGSFIVYYGGEPVLIDVGVGTYTRQTFSSQRYELWFMQSNYHNLPTFDGNGEKDGARYSSSNEQYDEATGRFTIEAAGAFTSDVGVKSFVRSMVLDGVTVRLYDKISLDKPREIDFHFMSAYKPEIIDDGKIALAAGRVLTYDPALSAEIEAFEAVGLEAKKEWGTSTLYRIHLRTTAKEFEGEFVIE